jgi:two-component system chemotaxis response regulator CheY
MDTRSLGGPQPPLPTFLPQPASLPPANRVVQQTANTETGEVLRQLPERALLRPRRRPTVPSRASEQKAKTSTRIAGAPTDCHAHIQTGGGFMTPAAPALIIDDEWMMAEVMIAILRKLMYPQVDVAAEGASALSMLMEKPYSLVVSDLNMEGMGGLELFRNMQADPELRDIPFILTTASLEPRHVVAAKQAGVRHYLLKPFTPGQLAQ